MTAHDQYLRKASRLTGNGDGHVLAPPIVMNATTGMIGWPEHTQERIKIHCLLNS